VNAEERNKVKKRMLFLSERGLVKDSEFEVRSSQFTCSAKPTKKTPPKSDQLGEIALTDFFFHFPVLQSKRSWKATRKILEEEYPYIGSLVLSNLVSVYPVSARGHMCRRNQQPLNFQLEAPGAAWAEDSALSDLQTLPKGQLNKPSPFCR
jgi:hypothetical protein